MANLLRFAVKVDDYLYIDNAKEIKDQTLPQFNFNLNSKISIGTN